MSSAESSTNHQLPQQGSVKPHAIQRNALSALERTRLEGFTAGLVVLATGLGKTWLAAFDSNRPDYRRVLFIAHREEILDQAVATFQHVRPRATVGRISGTYQELSGDLLFASVQTLARLPTLSKFQPDDFDYIVVDEFHHASAPTYRRIIDHFQPKFLLGLTATPDRTDGADLLALCQENLAYQANVRDGIEGGYLSPFHYFGVPDNVEYSNIPWRSTQFDIDELTAAVATETRARNALEQLRKHGGSRCIAFCCSQRHADFMAEFFVREGMRAVAVHSGPSSASRALSLDRLRSGELDTVFAVDMFNEGIDVPAVDTVLMLRPTESIIVWLQQIGRGLRVSPGKTHLTVIDYIGNHRSFLTKLQGMVAVLGLSAETAGRQREALQAIRDDTIDLPVGCEVTYDLAALAILEHLARPTRVEEELESFYRSFEERNGVRPTASEAYHAAFNPRSNSERSWLAFVERMSGFSVAEAAAWDGARNFFTSLEKREFARNELVVLLSMFDRDALNLSLSTEMLAYRAMLLTRRIHGLAESFAPHYSATEIKSLLIDTPVNSLTTHGAFSSDQCFENDGGAFSFAFPIADGTAFGAIFHEILDWKLAQSLALGPISEAILRVSHTEIDASLVLTPLTSKDRLPEGPMAIVIDSRPMQAIVVRSSLDSVRQLDGAENELPMVLRGWFGNDTGLTSRSDRVKVQRDGDKFVVEPIMPELKTSIRLWERYLREEIPPAFGLRFSQAIWNVGFVVRGSDLFLLVTLAKDGMTSEHRYADQFVSDQEFTWQSQNRTSQDSKHGQLMRDHRHKGVRVHLFVRATKKTGSKPTAFTYCGEVDFVSWEGDRPITVRWHLRQRVPASLHSTLSIPA
jgi:superfamily II DNA or RNA helicase